MDLTTGKVFICRHVRFDETIFPFVSLQVNQNPSAPTLPWGASPVHVATQPVSIFEDIPLTHEPTPLPIEAPSASTERCATTAHAQT